MVPQPLQCKCYFISCQCPGYSGAESNAAGCNVGFFMLYIIRCHMIDAM